MIITDIQRFCTHDGPGIRTTVFFKGCPLKCEWCHNPETQDCNPQLLFNSSLCINCGACGQVCGSHAHIFNSGTHLLNRELCTNCFLCTAVCASEACSVCGREITVDGVLREVVKDSAFYGATGGVTLSGGEPLAQAESIELLSKLKAAGINTAVETSGSTAKKRILEAADFTDLFLYDVKDTDFTRLKRYTGGDGSAIIENLLALDRTGKSKIILRCILVYGINTDETHYSSICRIFSGMINCAGVQFLPYHPYGGSKASGIFGKSNAHREWIPPQACIDSAKMFLLNNNVKIIEE